MMLHSRVLIVCDSQALRDMRLDEIVSASLPEPDVPCPEQDENWSVSSSPHHRQLPKADLLLHHSRALSKVLNLIRIVGAVDQFTKAQ
eukprot:6200330-Amphidinium_carterae.1